MLRTRVLGLGVALAVLAGTGVGGCRPQQDARTERPEPTPEVVEAPDPVVLGERAREAFGELPAEASSEENPITDAKTRLGRLLFFENRLSRSQRISCNSCHDLSNYGVDNQPTSPGHGGQRSERNAPSVFNSAFHVAQFWGGRAQNVEEGAKAPILDPVQMAMRNSSDVLVVLRSIPDYEPLFREAFPDEEDPLTFNNVARAIGAFQRRLVTPTRLGDFVKGDLEALSTQEQRGLELFLDVGCATCHLGPTVGGTLFRKIGLVRPYPTQDTGRFKVTNLEEDRFVFKVPSLLNVSKTAPYFHDGSVATLDEAVRLMARHQLGRELDDTQVEELVIFLRSLRGRIDKAYVERPKLPLGTPDTPRPDPS